MFKASSLANAITLIATLAFIFCGVLSYVAPDFFWGITSSWLHAINIESIKASEPMPLGTFILGIVYFAAYIWVVVFAAVTLYNRFARRKTVQA